MFIPKLKPLAEHRKLKSEDAWMARCIQVTSLSWTVLTEEVARILSVYIGNRKTLDAGSGTGFISAHLERLGVKNIVSSDFGGDKFLDYGMSIVYKRDHEGDSAMLLPGDFEIVLLSWPPYDDAFGFRVAEKMQPGTTLIYNGYGYGGCTGDDDFHVYLETNFVLKEDITDSLNRHHYKFPGTHDRWGVYKKKRSTI